MSIRSIKKFAAAAVLALAATTVHAAGVEHIVNGGFEAGINDLSSGLAGWSTTPSVYAFQVQNYAGPTCCGGFGTYQYGLKAAEFGAGNSVGGTLSQTFATLAGGSYSLSFLYGAFAWPGGERQKLAIDIVNAATAQVINGLTLTTRGTRDLSDMMDAYSLSFIAASGLTRVVFRDVSTVTLSTDGILDNVSVMGPVAPVPEPSTWMLMLSGLGFVGFLARRRSQQS